MLPARSLSFAKIVQVEDNAKKKPKFFSIGIVEAPPILWKDSANPSAISSLNGRGAAYLMER